MLTTSRAHMARVIVCVQCINEAGEKMALKIHRSVLALNLSSPAPFFLSLPARALSLPHVDR